ncbi:MAG: Gfo/Idh/MocA family oxidoreductase [Victivallales bacterium]|nr:Gfo/Idh/MocA family oxidoreductase [Victivallales bacterium]
MTKLKFALYGDNGHQICAALKDHPSAKVVAIAKFAKIPDSLRSPGVRICDSLDELLADPEIQAVSLCSPLRKSQAADALKCMRAGKHVLAEKPCAFNEEELGSIMQTSRKTKIVFHEMGGTVYSQPYAKIAGIVKSGKIGKVIQVLSQKSYPWGEWRPRNEDIDGGLVMQVGVYNCRFVEHVAGVKIKDIDCFETSLGNDTPGSDCKRAASFIIHLDNGGLASAVANYCCPKSPSWSKWGNECLTIFGAKGFIESRNGGEKVFLAVDGEPLSEPDISEPTQNYLDMVIQEMSTGKKIIPHSLEKELSPTKWAIRANAMAKLHQLWAKQQQ